MRRSICSCEPHAVRAGDLSTWKFSYTTASPLPKGSRIKFDLLSQGRPFDWQIPQTNAKSKENLIWMTLPNGHTVSAKETPGIEPWAPIFEFVLTEDVKTGETLCIHIGPSNRAQTHLQRRRLFHLYVDPKGKGEYKEPEAFILDVRGNTLENIRIIAPSLVSKNRRFDVIIRFEDHFGNLTNYTPEGTLVEVSYEHLRENLNWKLFIPETGFINLPNLYFNEDGIYQIQLRNLKNQQVFFSSPIKCSSETEKSIYWGLLHGESERIDSTENIESCLRYLRDEKNNQFFATSAFESAEETSNEAWKNISHQIAEFNEDFRFTTFLGCQFLDDEEKNGLRQIIYSKDNKPILRKKDSKFNSLIKIYKSHTPKDLLSIPSFSMGKGIETPFTSFTPEYERVVEIYNAWGSSECSEKEGNSRPILCSRKEGFSESDLGSVRKALNQNNRFGFVAGGLDDRGVYASCYENEQQQYSPGLTAVIALEHTKEAIWLALQNRACYATTGERIVVGFFIAGSMMGTELNTKAKPGLSLNRHITGYVAGTTPIEEIAIIRNGTVFKTWKPESPHADFAIDDSEPLAGIALPSSNERPAFIYYYLKATLENGHIAWSSPIWIDWIDGQAPVTTGKKKK